MSRRILISFILAAVLLLTTVASASAAGPAMTGTYQTPQARGTINFTVVKNVARLGSQGNFVISGKTFPGMMYPIRGTSNIGLVWYYGSSGIMAGTAVLSPTGTAKQYTGTLQFTSRTGAVISSGTLDVTLQ